MPIFESGSPTVLLAQDGAPPLTGTPTTTAPGTPASPTAKPAPGGFADNSFMFVLLAMLVGFVLLSMMGQRKEKKKRESMLNSVRKHDRVQTIGGVIGSVVEVKPDIIVLKVDEMSNTRMTFARSSIQQVLKEAPETADR
ncbi:MAG: preprotein translocase subunit YajC [Phycisphaerales bacterium]|nr:preprotein translocase subunit YajC [Phycisphaerales bacterium]